MADTWTGREEKEKVRFPFLGRLCPPFDFDFPLGFRDGVEFTHRGDPGEVGEGVAFRDKADCDRSTDGFWKIDSDSANAAGGRFFGGEGAGGDFATEENRGTNVGETGGGGAGDRVGERGGIYDSVGRSNFEGDTNPFCHRGGVGQADDFEASVGWGAGGDL